MLCVVVCSDGVVTIKFPVVSVSTKDLSQSLVCVGEWCNLFLLLFDFLCRLNHSHGFSIVCSDWVDVEPCKGCRSSLLVGRKVLSVL